MTILVTGGAGFIGSNFIIQYLKYNDENVINVDKLTYAGNIKNLSTVGNSEYYKFYKADISDHRAISDLLNLYQPRAIINFAAETHVDNSIHHPTDFVSNNINGVLALLNSSLEYYTTLSSELSETFRFIQISTDEVYGSLEDNDPSFTENSAYRPNSPYAASKASCDHLVRAWHKTYGLPTITSNCSNNYGPRQYPEKLIPVVISQALSGQRIPLYGDGMNIRDWLYVDDHCSAIRALLDHGTPGDNYNIGGYTEKTNIDVVMTICKILDQLTPISPSHSFSDQIEYVEDRRGHDRRYSINNHKISEVIDWRPTTDFKTGIRKTIQWYLDNNAWLKPSDTAGNYHTSNRDTAADILPFTTVN